MQQRMRVREALDQFISDCELGNKTGRLIAPLDVMVGGQPLNVTAHASTNDNAIDVDDELAYVFCVAPVCRLEPASDQAYRLMLQSNNLWAGTRGATLGIDDDDRVVLSMSRPLDGMTGHSLHQLLSTLAGDARKWGARLDDLRKVTSGAQSQQTLLLTPSSCI